MNPLAARYRAICLRLGDIRVHRAQLELEAVDLEREAMTIQAALRATAQRTSAQEGDDKEASGC